MWMKILRILLLYSGLLLLANVAISVFFAYIFGGGDNPLLQVPFNFLFTWIAGYKGVKAFSKIDGVNKVLGSPFWQGASIALVAGILGSIVVYLLTKEIVIGQGLAIMLIGGFGGKRAVDETTKKLGKIPMIIGAVVLGIFMIIVLFIVGNAAQYRFSDVKTISQEVYTTYEDKKFSYSFTYPKSWKRSTYPLAQGQTTITSDKDPKTSMFFWYKDSEPVKNVDELLTFVKDDAKYGETEQGAKTISIEKTMVNGKEVVLWTARYDDNGTYSKVYYFPDYTPVEGQLIHIWVASVNTIGKEVPDEKEEVDKTLNSFTVLEP